jgi:hypothetical protein
MVVERSLDAHHFMNMELEKKVVVSVLDTGVSRSTCSWAPSTAQLWPRGGTTTKASGEDPHEEVPHKENNDQNY